MQRARPGHPGDVEDRKAATLTKAALECARHLGLSAGETASVLGVPHGVLAAMKKEERAVDGVSGEAERADALVRITKSLNSLAGDTDTAWRSWMRRENPGLDEKPIDLMMQRDGVLKVAAYLEREKHL